MPILEKDISAAVFAWGDGLLEISNAYEKHIQDIESKLMQQYRCGYSALHKILIKEKAEQIRSSKFWNS